MKKVDHKNRIRRNLLLRALLDNGKLSLTDLSQKTGVTLPVVAKIVESLKRKGFVADAKDTQISQAGRPPSVVKLNGSAGYILGVDLGKGFTNLVLVDLEKTIILQVHLKVAYLSNEIGILKLLKEEIKLFLDNAGVGWKSILGIGFSIPGIVDGPGGLSETYLNFGNGKLLRVTLQEFFEKTVLIEHDAKAMALGELWFGEAKNVRNALCLRVDLGLGLGIIIDGRIYYGNHSYAGEFGHILSSSKGLLCYCGKRGCLETVASGQAITNSIREKISNGAVTLLIEKLNGNIDKHDWLMVVESANSGDQFSMEILEETAAYLGQGIGTLINLFSPEKVIIGGGMSNALPPLFLDIARISAAKTSLPQLNRSVEFANSTLEPVASALGVAMLAARDLFEVEHLNPLAFV